MYRENGLSTSITIQKSKYILHNIICLGNKVAEKVDEAQFFLLNIKEQRTEQAVHTTHNITHPHTSHPSHKIHQHQKKKQNKTKNKNRKDNLLRNTRQDKPRQDIQSI